MRRRSSGGNIIDAILFGALLRLPFPINLMFSLALFYLAIATVVIGVIAVVVGLLSYGIFQIAKQTVADVRLNRRKNERATVLGMITSPHLRELLERGDSSSSAQLIYAELRRNEAGGNVDNAANEFLEYLQKHPEAATLGDMYRILGRAELNRQKAACLARAKADFLQGAIGIRLTGISQWLREVTDFSNSDVRSWLLFWMMSFAALLFIVSFFFYYNTAYQMTRASVYPQSMMTSPSR